MLWQITNDAPEQIGIVTNIQGNILTVDAFLNAAEFEKFCFTKKNPRVEGSEIRGYYLEVKLEDETDTKNEIFGISSEISKSYL